MAAAAERIAAPAGECQRYGRRPGELTVSVALTDGDPGMLPELARAGLTELVLVDAPPADPAAVPSWVTGLAARWRPVSAR
jgi:hypothetical protein